MSQRERERERERERKREKEIKKEIVRNLAHQTVLSKFYCLSVRITSV